VAVVLVAPDSVERAVGAGQRVANVLAYEAAGEERADHLGGGAAAQAARQRQQVAVAPLGGGGEDDRLGI
jgi:hypothetical protein